MLKFEFRCSDCEAYFELTVNENEDLDNALCPNCKSETWECCGFDMSDNPKLFELNKRITDIEWRLKQLEDIEFMEDGVKVTDLTIN